MCVGAAINQMFPRRTENLPVGTWVQPRSQSGDVQSHIGKISGCEKQFLQEVWKGGTAELIWEQQGEEKNEAFVCLR